MPPLSKRRRNDSGDISDDDSEFNSTKNNTMAEEDDEDGDDVADSDLLSPSIMQPLVQEFNEYVKRNNKETTLARHMNKLAEDFIRERDEDVEVDRFVKAYKKYFTLANKGMSVKTASDCILEFLDRGDAVKLFPGFPKPPPNLLNFYAKKYHVQVGFGKRGQAKMIMANDTERRRACEQELHEIEEKFLKDLESFFRENKEYLNKAQRTYLEGKIKACNKKINPIIKEPKTPKGSKAGSRTEPKTAFEYFLKTMKDKYTDLEPEVREKKLRKKFNKLDDDTREIFEKIAMQ